MGVSCWTSHIGTGFSAWGEISFRDTLSVFPKNQKLKKKKKHLITKVDNLPFTFCPRAVTPCCGKGHKFQITSESFFLTLTNFYLINGDIEGYCYSTTHAHILHSIGFLWTRDRQVAETSIWKHIINKGDRHFPGGIKNSQSQQVSGRRPTP